MGGRSYQPSVVSSNMMSDDLGSLWSGVLDLSLAGAMFAGSVPGWLHAFTLLVVLSSVLDREIKRLFALVLGVRSASKAVSLSISLSFSDSVRSFVVLCAVWGVLGVCRYDLARGLGVRFILIGVLGPSWLSLISSSSLCRGSSSCTVTRGDSRQHLSSLAGRG